MTIAAGDWMGPKWITVGSAALSLCPWGDRIACMRAPCRAFWACHSLTGRVVGPPGSPFVTGALVMASKRIRRLRDAHGLNTRFRLDAICSLPAPPLHLPETWKSARALLVHCVHNTDPITRGKVTSHDP